MFGAGFLIKIFSIRFIDDRICTVTNFQCYSFVMLKKKVEKCVNSGKNFIPLLGMVLYIFMVFFVVKVCK